jgi:hypothetical protein
MIDLFAPFPEDENTEEECGDLCGAALAERVCDACDETFVACYDHETYVMLCEICREV